MKTNQPSLFESERMRMEQAMELTAESLRAHGAGHSHWVIAWSGGKDSTALLSIVLHLIWSGRVLAPARLTVCYADTRMELPPLSYSALQITSNLRARGIEVRHVMAPMDKRFFVYMFGRGVPPPNNNTFRWCTRQIKVDPMADEIRRLVESEGRDVLMLTGVRQGESAIRDGRIAMSCGRDGAECGQGWYQQMEGKRLATLAPILHWRVCHVWDWLMVFAPADTGLPTGIIAEAYGGDEAEEINARTGCVGCPLASKDTALDAVLRQDAWKHLAPLKELRPLYRELRLPEHRLRKGGGETRKDGTPVRNQFRMGPLTMESRRMALDRVLSIQRRINLAANEAGRPIIDILNDLEADRIRWLIQCKTWPQKWTGEESRADEDYEELVMGSLWESIA